MDIILQSTTILVEMSWKYLPVTQYIQWKDLFASHLINI